MKAIYKRELRSYFTTPIGFVYLAIFLAVNGLLFSVATILAGAASYIQNYFSYLLLSFVLLIPILTMKVFAEERKTKTEQLLLTAPVSLFAIVMGKFLAAFSVFASGILVSCFNFIILFEYGSAPVSILIGSVIVILLIGGSCIAVGVFVSSLTENQFVSCIITMAILLILIGTSIIEASVSSTVLKTILSWISILSRFTNFTYGIFDIPAVIYYISLSSIFVFLTVRVLEKRRWN